jgi:hypothetical protein
LLWRIRKHFIFPIRKWRQSILPQPNGISSSIKSIALAWSFAKNLPDLGSSNKFVLPWWKHLHHFIIVGRASASGPYINSSSAWIALAFSPLSVKNESAVVVPYKSEPNLHTFKIWRPSHSADSKLTERGLKTNKRDGDLLHISVVYSLKARTGLEMRGWIRNYGSSIYGIRKISTITHLSCDRIRNFSKGLSTILCFLFRMVCKWRGKLRSEQFNRRFRRE